ncbi:hypothetical protein PENTCL1PPCAC_21017, partial [Pristionchus entomophagus]
VLPPRRLHVPVLPAHKNGKLLFALCPKCCDEKTNSLCTHSDAERTMTGIWATVELELALEKQYRIVECIEVLNSFLTISLQVTYFQAIHYDMRCVYSKPPDGPPMCIRMRRRMRSWTTSSVRRVYSWIRIRWRSLSKSINKE